MQTLIVALRACNPSATDDCVSTAVGDEPLARSSSDRFVRSGSAKVSLRARSEQRIALAVIVLKLVALGDGPRRISSWGGESRFASRRD